MPKRRNGLFVMKDGTKAFISGIAENYLFIHTEKYDFYLPIINDDFRLFAHNLLHTTEYISDK